MKGGTGAGADGEVRLLRQTKYSQAGTTELAAEDVGIGH